MMASNIERVSALIASTLGLSPDSVNAESSMETVPQWDSLAQLNICLAVQEQFGVDMDMDAIGNATSVAKLAALLDQR